MKSERAYRFGPFEFYPSKGRLLGNGSPIPLRPKVFDLLNYMVQNPGRVVSKEELLGRIWPEAIVSESTLTSTVSSLREALGDDPRQFRYLETVSKKGYRFTASVERVPFEGENSGASEPLTRSKRRRYSAILVATATLTLGFIAGGWLLGPGIAPAFDRPAANHGLAERTESQPSPDEKPVSLLEGRNLSDPAISPDGQWVVFSWRRAEGDSPNIYLVSNKGGEPVRLTDGPSTEWSPVWSPDSQVVAFLRYKTSEHSSSRDIVLIRPFEELAERTLHRFEKPQRTVGDLSWGQAGLLVAARQSPDDLGAVYQFDVEKGTSRRIDLPAMTPPIMLAHPTASPNGSEFALIGWTPDQRSDIYLLGVADGSLRRLTFHKNYIRGLTWAKGGAEIVYSTLFESPDFQSRLWSISPHDGRPRKMFLGAGSYPRNSNNGSLVYLRRPVRTEIVQLDLKSGRISSYIPGDSIDHSPMFSPIAQKALFVSNRAGEYQIWLAEGDGRQCRPLRPLVECSAQPSWSPDGSWVAFTSFTETQGDIYVARLDTGAPSPISLHPAHEEFPSWSRDGKWIYFGSLRGGTMEIWKSPVGGGEPIQLTRTGGRRPLEGPAGRFVYYEKQIREGIWRSTIDGQDERLVIEDYKSSLGAWDVADSGVYYEKQDPSRQGRSIVAFHDFETGLDKDIAAVDRSLATANITSLTVSHDERTALLTAFRPDKSEIVLVKNLRHLR